MKRFKCVLGDWAAVEIFVELAARPYPTTWARQSTGGKAKFFLSCKIDPIPDKTGILQIPESVNFALVKERHLRHLLIR